MKLAEAQRKARGEQLDELVLSARDLELTNDVLNGALPVGMSFEDWAELTGAVGVQVKQIKVDDRMVPVRLA